MFKVLVKLNEKQIEVNKCQDIAVNSVFYWVFRTMYTKSLNSVKDKT